MNLDGTFYCMHAVLPSMRARKEGLLINIASWAGKYTLAMAGGAYNGSKHAVVALTETLNMEECVNGIRACALCPAEVATPILDRRPIPPSPEERARMLQADDIGGHDPLDRRAAAARLRQRDHRSARPGTGCTSAART